MAREFDDNQANYLTTEAVVSSGPVTFACWAWLHDGVGTDTLISITDSGASGAIVLRHSTSTLEVKVTTDGNSTALATSASIRGSEWAHCCGVFASTASRTCYTNGVAGIEDTNIRAWPTGLDNTSLGITFEEVVDDEMDGLMAEVGIWNAALSDAEVASLAAGMSPLMVRPQSLVGYWPLNGRYGRD